MHVLISWMLSWEMSPKCARVGAVSAMDSDGVTSDRYIMVIGVGEA